MLRGGSWSVFSFLSTPPNPPIIEHKCVKKKIQNFFLQFIVKCAYDNYAKHDFLFTVCMTNTLYNVYVANNI